MIEGIDLFYFLFNSCVVLIAIILLFGPYGYKRIKQYADVEDLHRFWIVTTIILVCLIYVWLKALLPLI